ncbi:MAG: helix-turn-helix domain-containing protein [Thermoguttaceae bacterium]|nr:helix-turn-helix domain-containing protein [Thermoguttaceae bacterium]
MTPPVESILKSLRTTIGETPVMERVYRRLPALAKSGVSLFLIGELGVGKQILAEAIAQIRAIFHHQPNLRWLMLDGRMDGTGYDTHVTGASATTNDIFGLFGESEGPPLTCYLAHVEAFPLEIQRRFLRWWDTHPALMVIASTTQSDLPLLLEQERLDEALYYRLGGSRLELPPLRKRPKDIQRLANHWLIEMSRPYTNRIMEWEDAAVQFLTAYDWPGNRYELKSTMFFAIQQWIEANEFALESHEDIDVNSHSGVALDGNVDKSNSDQENHGDHKNYNVQENTDEKKNNSTGSLENVDSPISLSANFLPPVIRGETPRESLSSRFRSRLSFADLVVEVIEKGLTEEAELAQAESRDESDHLYERILEPLERELIRQVYEDCRHVRIHTATRLGINRNTLYKKLADYELEPDQ